MEDGQLAAVPLKYRAGVHSHKCRLRLCMVAVCPVLAPVYPFSCCQLCQLTKQTREQEHQNLLLKVAVF